MTEDRYKSQSHSIAAQGRGTFNITPSDPVPTTTSLKNGALHNEQ